jgi:integrase
MARHSFAKGKTQAARIVVEMSTNGMKLNLGTERSAKQSLAQFADWLRQERRGDLLTCERQAAVDYLEQRAELIQQKALDLDRQSLDKLLAYRGESDGLPRIKSERDRIVTGRAYTPEQVQRIIGAQREHNAITTELAYRSGLRAHEVYTVMKINCRERSDRRLWRSDLFTGREGDLYTVKGKGGLVRLVSVPRDLSIRLEAMRLDSLGLNSPRQVTDRGVHYQQYYAIGAGQAWSQSVSAAAMRQLGWSTGGHGMRHSYAQERLAELQSAGYGFADAKVIVSQELGHFRSSVVEFYLR